MLFITNRVPKGSFRTQLGRDYHFDLKNNSAGGSVYYCERTAKEQYTEIGSSKLMSRLKEGQAKQLLFYIHGFSNLPEPDIFPRAVKLQEYFDSLDPDMIEVVPIIWPCDNDLGIVKDYWDDQKSADNSAFAFARVFGKFLEWRNKAPEGAPCLKRINVMAHSMGNRVFRETLVNWNKYDLPSGVPMLFRNTFLMAADIVNESLEEGKPGRMISQASRNVSVYYASDDLALRSSKVSNLKNSIASRRLGHSGPEDMSKVQSNVYAIDCDSFNNSYDWPMGHAYFMDAKNDKMGSVFQHMFNSLKSGRVEVDNIEQRTHTL